MSGGTPAVTSTNQHEAKASAGACWDAFRHDPRGRDFCLGDEVERDVALDISSILRPVRITLSHPLDQLAMAAVPGQMEIHFRAPPPLLYQADRRDIAVVPSQEEFLGWHGLLPSIEIIRDEDDSGAGTVTWRVVAPGEDAAVCFLFETGAAPLARASLRSLANAANFRCEAFEQMISELEDNADVGSWNSVRRTLASNFWKDLPERARQRVIDYFRSDARAAALVSGTDIGAALREASSLALAAVAGELLLAGLLYWKQRCAASLVPDCFWDDEMARAVPFNARGADFTRALQTTLDAYARWIPTRRFYRDVLRDMDRSALAADSGYQRQRARLSRALLRGGGQRVGKAGSVTREQLDLLDPEQVRQRLAEAMPALVALAVVAQVGSLAFHARLAQALDGVIAPPPIVLDEGDLVDEAAMLRDALCGDAEDGVSLLVYRLAPTLPPAQVAAVWAVQCALLPNGELPLQVVCKDDGGAGAQASWRRIYRFIAARRFDAATQSWLGSDREVSVEGRDLHQRQALDRHMATIIAGLAECQQEHFRRRDRANLVIDGHADVLLPPVSRFARRQIRFTGSGGRLVLPAQLRGSVQIDCTGLDPQAPVPLLQLDPALAASLQRGDTAQRGARHIDSWRGADCVLLVSENAGSNRCAQALAMHVDAQARRRLRNDLCNPALSQVVVGPGVTGDIELVPPGRDIVLQAQPGRQRFVLRCLGRATTWLRVVAAEAMGRSAQGAPFALSIDLRTDKLPRYTISQLERNAAGGWSGQVLDNMAGGCLHLELAPGVPFDRATWAQARCRTAAIGQQALADIAHWSAQLGDMPSLDASQFREILAYGVQLNALEDHPLARKALILQAQWSAESPLLAACAASPGALGPERLAQARQIVCRLVAYLFRDDLHGMDDTQWQQSLCDDQARGRSMPLQRVQGIIGCHDAVCGAHAQQDVLVFSDAVVAAPSASATSAASASAPGSVLIFTGALDTACPWWTWRMPDHAGMQARLAFQLVPGMGWLLQPPHGQRAALQAVVRDGAAGAGAWQGVSEHLQAALLAIKGASVCSGCAHLAAQPWVDDKGMWRADLPLYALSDLAGNRYLLVGEAAASLRQWQCAKEGVCSMTVTAKLVAAGSMASAPSMLTGEVTLLPQEALQQVFGACALQRDQADGKDPCADFASRLRAAMADKGPGGA